MSTGYMRVFWQHKHFQDRVVHLWEVLASRYKGNPWVAGYNPMNEPGDVSAESILPFYRRLSQAIRAVDPDHILFLEGNRYSTEFQMFTELWPHVIYTAHDYALPGFANGGPYPDLSRGEFIDKTVLEETFLRRTAFMRQTQTPIWVVEFGPVHVGDPAKDAMRYQVLRKQEPQLEHREAGCLLRLSSHLLSWLFLCSERIFGESDNHFRELFYHLLFQTVYNSSEKEDQSSRFCHKSWTFLQEKTTQPARVFCPALIGPRVKELVLT